jgi:hypothetical protein
MNAKRQDQADGHRMPAATDVVRSEARTDRTLLDDCLRSCQRAGAQQQRQLASFAGLQTGDAESRRQHALNRRRADDLFLGADRAAAHALALLAFGELLLGDVHHRHALADVVFRGVEHRLAAARIQRHVDLGLTFLKGGLRVRQLLTRSR